MTATDKMRTAGEMLREGTAAEGLREELVPGVVDVGDSEPSVGVRDGFASEAGDMAGVSVVGIVPEGLGETDDAGEADGPKATGPGAGTGAPGEALH